MVSTFFRLFLYSFLHRHVNLGMSSYRLPRVPCLLTDYVYLEFALSFGYFYQHSSTIFSHYYAIFSAIPIVSFAYYSRASTHHSSLITSRHRESPLCDTILVYATELTLYLSRTTEALRPRLRHPTAAYV
jgi:hypothetical protein